MSQISLWFTLFGVIVLLLGLGAGLLMSRNYFPSEPILAVFFGIIIGPHGVGVLQLTRLGEPLLVLEYIAQFTVALAIMSIALRLPPEYFSARARSLATILGPGMVTMWLASSLVAYVALAVGPLIALLIGAIMTPTDPVLANSIVVGETAKRNIPVRLRYLLSGEAGINDGVAHLFVFLPLLTLRHPFDVALTEWIVYTLLWEVLSAILLGFIIGAGIGRSEQWESSKDFLEEASLLTITVALTFTVLGVVELVGGIGILAVFVAGVAYNWQADPEDEEAEERIQEVINRLFTYPIFVLFGMVIPWSGWIELGWRGPVLVGGVLLFRRLPMVLTLRPFISSLDRSEATLFVGWFGPIGVAAVFYATLARAESGVEVAWIAGSLVVFGSILVHGLTSTVGTHWYGRTGDADESW